MKIARLADPKRIAGAAAFALCWTLVLAIFQALDRDIDVAELAASSLGVGLVGYLAWPALGDIWARRDKREDGKRFLMLGLGLAGGFALSRAVSFLAAEDSRWSVGLWLVSVLVIFGLVLVRVWRVRRS